MVRGILIKLVIVVSLINVIAITSPIPAHAQGVGVEDCSRSILGFPTWYRYLELDGVCNVSGPLNEDNRFDWQRAAGYIAVAVLEILLRLGALVAVGYVIYGGFKFITSQGEPENAKNARNTILNAIIGLVITIASASIVAFIANRLTS